MSKTRLDWSQEAERQREGMIALRRDFHRHPELSFQEVRTAGIVGDRLEALGYGVTRGVGGASGGAAGAST